MKRELYEAHYPSKREWDKLMEMISDGADMAIIRPEGKLGTFAITLTGNVDKITQALNDYGTPKLVSNRSKVREGE